jgi:hypothetical protein
MRTASTRTRVAISALLAGMIASFGGVDPAAAQSKCQSLKFKAAGAVAKRKATCHARAAKEGTPVDAQCLADANDQLARKWFKADAMGDCVSTNDFPAGISATDECLTAIDAVVDPPPPFTSPCCNLGNSCAHGIDDASCVSFFSGTPGPAGSVCNGATGTCGPPPAGAGRCCMRADGTFCTAGPNLNLAGCVPPEFLDAPFATCAPSGACALP